MARVTVPHENRTLTDPQEIVEFLKPFGIWYEKWDVEGRVDGEATGDEILIAYQAEIKRLKEKVGELVIDLDILKIASENRPFDPRTSDE